MLKLALTPRWIGGLLMVLLLVAGFMSLSKWQFDASARSLTSLDPAKDTLRPYSEVLVAGEPLTALTADTVAEAQGRYVPGSSYLVANRFDDGQAGYWVVSEFVPTGSATVAAENLADKPRALAVARAWVKEPVIPAEPAGELKIAGRIIANDGPVSSHLLPEADAERVLGSVATAQLANLWDSPLYGGILTLQAEVPASEKIPANSEGVIDPAATIMGQQADVRPIHAEQITNTQHNWLNIFYAAEWVIFAAFALYIWWRTLKDAVEKQKNPTHYYEYSGEAFFDEEAGRYYYFDPEANQYFYFDEEPQTTP